VALYAALNESQAVREQTSASVWPYVQLMISDTDDGESAHFALRFENVGVGPARMRGLSLSLAGEPVTSWAEVVDRVRHPDSEAPRLGVDYGQSSVSHQVIAPGNHVKAFQTTQRSLALGMQEAVYTGRTRLRYCFCSIFDDCWLGSLGPDEQASSVRPVDACPDFGAQAFSD